MPASSRNDSREITTSDAERKASGQVYAPDPRKRPGGQVCALARYPKEFAKAIDFLHSLGLTPRELRIMTEIVRRADLQGLYWGRCGDGGASGDVGELVALTGYRPQTIRVTARKMRALGLLTWEWVKAGARYPRRDPRAYALPALAGKGVKTEKGGRCWAVPWAKFGVNFPCAPCGPVSPRLIQGDQSRLIPGDQSSDPLSFGEDLKKDPAPSGPGAPPAPRRVGVARTTRNPAPPPAAHGASETPRAAIAPRASQRVSGREPEIVKLERGASTRPAAPVADGEDEATVKASEIRDFILELFHRR